MRELIARVSTPVIDLPRQAGNRFRDWAYVEGFRDLSKDVFAAADQIHTAEGDVGEWYFYHPEKIGPYIRPALQMSPAERAKVDPLFNVSTPEKIVYIADIFQQIMMDERLVQMVRKGKDLDRRLGVFAISTFNGLNAVTHNYLHFPHVYRGISTLAVKSMGEYLQTKLDEEMNATYRVVFDPEHVSLTIDNIRRVQADLFAAIYLLPVGNSQICRIVLSFPEYSPQQIQRRISGIRDQAFWTGDSTHMEPQTVFQANHLQSPPAALIARTSQVVQTYQKTFNGPNPLK